jgi:hypothetical protein
MPGNSVTILSSQVHAGDSAVQTVTSDKVQGDGYYGRSDGFHTVQINLADFTGDLTFQGTLAITPTDEDWFDIETTDQLTTLSYSSDSTTVNIFKNFIGNFVWIRVQVTNWTTGSISSILMNH